jgi:hypothetical protein
MEIYKFINEVIKADPNFALPVIIYWICIVIFTRDTRLANSLCLKILITYSIFLNLLEYIAKTA